MPSSKPELDTLVQLYSALGDETRLSVLELLGNKPRPVHDLAAAFDISRPAISRHLRVLKEAGLVVEEKRGRENVYALVRPRLAKMSSWLAAHAIEKLSKPVVAKPAKPVKKKAKPAAAKPKSAAKAKAAAKAKTPAASVPKVSAAKPVSVEPAPQMGFDF
jgi:DNA-binding transcriptional ArsR family regulator